MSFSWVWSYWIRPKPCSSEDESDACKKPNLKIIHKPFIHLLLLCIVIISPDIDQPVSKEDEADEKSESDEGKRTPKGRGRRKQPSPSPKTFPMDMISPLGGKIQKKLPIDKVGPPSSMASRKPKAFPIPSPQTSDKATIRVTSQSKGKNKAKPFPEEELSKHQKRMTEGRSYDEQQSRKKRQRSLSYVFLCSNFNVVFVGLILLDQT